MSSTEPRRESAPTLQGRYRLVRTLAVSQLGATFLGYDLRLHRWRAIDVPADEDAARVLVGEAEVLARLEHPSIERVLDVGEDGAVAFVVRDRLHGTAAEHQPMPATLATLVVARIAEGLAHANARGVVHGHIRPSAIRFSEDGSPVLTGFGRQTRLESSTSARSAEPWAHLAPELRRTGIADPRTEVYGLGATLYTLVAGRHQADLFYAEAYDGLMTPVPIGLRPVIYKACAYEPEERPEDVEAFRSLLASRMDREASLSDVPWRAEVLPNAAPDLVVPDGQLQILIAMLGSSRPAAAQARPVEAQEAASTLDSASKVRYAMPRLLRKDPGFRDPFEPLDPNDLPSYVDPLHTPELSPRRPPPFTVRKSGSGTPTPVPTRRTRGPGMQIAGTLFGGLAFGVGVVMLVLIAVLGGFAWVATTGMRADRAFVDAVLAEGPSVEVIASTSLDRRVIEESWFRFADAPTPDNGAAYVRQVMAAAQTETATSETRTVARRLEMALERWEAQ